ncbi:twin-arginine translocation signal domain-containing protein [Streptomyces ziwulingensis]|uniref:Uncharacterized protein n=1 Tax=Streptomyces ziwulingensis TaxID=1045501 RepID=A0ABP9CKB8_9ACTN
MSRIDGRPASSLSRRTLLTGTAATAAAVTLGSRLGTGPAHAAAFVKGADISWASQMEAGGYIWRDRNGVAPLGPDGRPLPLGSADGPFADDTEYHIRSTTSCAWGMRWTFPRTGL